MTIVGIGTDLVSIQRIQKIWERFGESFAKRILTKGELEDLKKTPTPVSFLAKRYAAKEAVAKALGTGFRPGGLLLNEIGVKNDALGRPHLYFEGRTAEVLAHQGATESFITLSDEREHALAFVILTGKKMPQ